MLQIVLISIAAFVLTQTAEGHDLEVKAVKFYALIPQAGYVVGPDKKVVAVKKGQRVEFDEYAPHSGLAPDILEAGVTIANSGETNQLNVQIRLAVSPKVGKVTFYQGTPDLPIHEETEASAEWFAPILLLKQVVGTVPAGQTVNVFFRNINLGSILKDYNRRHLWPIMLNFEVSVEPVNSEDTFKNNTVRRFLKVGMWE